MNIKVEATLAFLEHKNMISEKTQHNYTCTDNHFRSQSGRLWGLLSIVIASTIQKRHINVKDQSAHFIDKK